MSSPPPLGRPTLLARLSDAIYQAAVQGVFFHQARADHLGMNLTDFECFGLLAERGPMPAGQLAALIGLTTGAVTHALDRLEKSGWIQRRGDPADRRRVIVEAVPERVRQASAGLESLADGMQRLTASYSDQDLARMVEFLESTQPMMRQEIARLRGGPADETVLSAPLAEVDAGRLLFRAGGARLILGTDPDMEELFRARFEGRVPRVEVDQGQVVIEPTGFTVGSLVGKGLRAEIVLNPRVPWSIQTFEGLGQLEADLSGLVLRGVDIGGGLARAEVSLPRPNGSVPLRVRGGVNRAAFHRPPGVGLRLHIRGGASRVVLDDEHLPPSGADTNWTSDEDAHSANRYEIEITGGASRLTVDVR